MSVLGIILQITGIADRMIYAQAKWLITVVMALRTSFHSMKLVLRSMGWDSSISHDSHQ